MHGKPIVTVLVLTEKQGGSMGEVLKVTPPSYLGNHKLNQEGNNDILLEGGSVSISVLTIMAHMTSSLILPSFDFMNGYTTKSHRARGIHIGNKMSRFVSGR